MFQELFPIITTPDLNRALGFYRDLLGFDVAYRFPEDGSPAYVTLHLGSSQLGIGVAPDAADTDGGPAPVHESSSAGSFALWTYADDCDAAIERLREHGVTILQEPEDQPWGERVATVADPDGNRVLIGARSEAGVA